MKRIASFDRQTTETRIKGRLIIDGEGRYNVSTGIRFFDHMLELFTPRSKMPSSSRVMRRRSLSRGSCSMPLAIA